MFKKKKDIDFIYDKTDYVNRIANTEFNNLEEVISSPIGLDNRIDNINKFGANTVVVKKFNWLKEFIGSLTELFNLLLLAIGTLEIIIFLTLETGFITLVSALIIYFMVILAACVDFQQEYKAYKESIQLHHEIENEIYILTNRVVDINTLDNQKQDLVKIKQSELTIGDVIYLSPGDIVPTDCRIIKSNDLYIDQSTLNGETEYILKSINNTKERLLDLENILFAHTMVKQGNCYAVVINISVNNYSDSIGNTIEDIDDESDYERSLKKISQILIGFILIITPIIFVISWSTSGFAKNDFVGPLVFALSIAVALVPEALPAIISANLKLGSKVISKNKVIIKNLACIQNMGSVNVLTTDKTGTLTLNEFEVNNIVDYSFNQSDWLNTITSINAHASNMLNNKIDSAINNHFKDLKIKYELISTIDFSHENKLSGVIAKVNKQKLLIIKGSFEEVIKLISKVRNNNKVEDVKPGFVEKLNEFNNQQANLNNKILIVASKVVDSKDNSVSELVFEGFVGLEEKLKQDVIRIIKIFQNYGIDIKVLTGDNEKVSENLVKKIGLDVKKISGEQIVSVSEELIKSFNLFYELSPLDKAQIISILQKDNVVAFLGDGVNDAIGLKKADVGISVNDGSALAKQSADIIMLEKDLDVLEQAFIQGRKTFANAVKFVNITIASNLGLLITLLISSIWFSLTYKANNFIFLPMSPIQLLLQNLIFDFANLVFVLDSVDDNSIKSPSRWSTKSIIPFALWNGTVHVIVSCINFLIMGYGFKMFQQITNGNVETLHQFQTAFFIEVVITHIILIMVYRTSKFSFTGPKSNSLFNGLMLMFAFIPFLIILIDLPIHKMELEFIKNGFWYLTLLGLITLSFGLAELFKHSYIRFNNKWI
ncbi:HAD-IC family P-type ATPase [Mesoplasma corruscae]|uniref:Mg(2+) transport ATPase, P-type n=1 Tax=Mesoplasma corruscae TaxID=216874 RepID=A0A2S5RGC8_9MOLU|nr:HAD-IC family P-type ATPase [Mesoplasma corruscae]PPE06386.1 Mg(2+) transport ATPase, P-type [Mesoplasma corruscae]